MDPGELSKIIPAAWAARKVLGPTLDTVGQDISEVYRKGSALIFTKAKRKITNIDDNKTANLRVTRDVFWNGAFTDEDICAEYFGGILAGSRSTDGKDDTGIFYLDLVKSLSSSQLKLHYYIYSSLNRILFGDAKYHSLNVAVSKEIQAKSIYFSTPELIDLGINFEVDLVALADKNLIGTFTYSDELHPDKHHLTQAVPTTLGVQLFAVAANMLPNYREFSSKLFDNFDFSEKVPKVALSAEELIPKKIP